ncbi:hypothetical protein [Homoserinibacter sp. GY 40078]|uniref:hypothetical protein n=1 Tax=Homoserinibacter sp. GY 40078 TaxID=2603275 RepID=UPI0011CB8DE3|nr:hypothetical protein [Homoserinibacter sp. GY 40078]TXK19481.1 hypothetical protein FVQ89_06215 [Homoserinibacter sp. GY 40078]
MKTKKVVALGAALGVAISGAAIAFPAAAEPVSNSYVLVGSDTLQDSTNALINGTSITGTTVRVTSANTTLGSFDAFGSALIQTKTGGPYFQRPAGSGAGVTALRASITGASYGTPAKTITGQVDIARSSSGPGANASSTGLLSYIPYARDAVSFAYKGGTSAWATLDAATLKQVYECTLTTIDGVAVTPRLPQNGSGTRSFFLSAIGVSTPGSCTNAAASTLPENDASVLGTGEIIPFSVASWVAQANGATPSNTTTTSGVALGSAVSGQVPYTGSGSSLVPSSGYYANSTFGRDTYLVVEYARINSSDPKYDAKLAALVSTSGNSLINFGSLFTTPGAVKSKYGFLAPSTTVPQRAFNTL